MEFQPWSLDTLGRTGPSDERVRVRMRGTRTACGGGGASWCVDDRGRKMRQQRIEAAEKDPTVKEQAKDQMIWTIDGEQSDLTPFLKHHPGGPDFLLQSVGRDVSILVHTYHKNPQKTVLPLLKKYKVPKKLAPEDALKKKMGVPHFLLPPEFDALEDVPQYSFDPEDKTLLLNECRRRINKPEVQAKIRALDRKFDQCATAFVGIYFALLASWLGGSVPWYISVPSFVFLRTAIAGAGHYFVHRAKPSMLDALFDVNYVGMAMVALDGHVLLHHAYTQSDADVKRGFFGGMMGIPRLLRVPCHTVHKLGHVTTGMLIRGVQVEFERCSADVQGAQARARQMSGVQIPKRLPFKLDFWVVHVWLRVELILALHSGVGWSWLGQFVATLWLNTLMVVSSHDFETSLFPKDRSDWGRYQLLNTHDMSITGLPYVDVWLSAGLSPHRAHHLLPYQRSGFANVFSTDVIRGAALALGEEWHRPLSFFTEIFPQINEMYLSAPSADAHTRKPLHDNFWEEHTAFSGYRYSFMYIISGFLGIGSV